MGDLEAMIAEAEAETQRPKDTNPAASIPQQEALMDADAEEAMAEMDGLW